MPPCCSALEVHAYPSSRRGFDANEGPLHPPFAPRRYVTQPKTCRGHQFGASGQVVRFPGVALLTLLGARVEAMHLGIGAGAWYLRREMFSGYFRPSIVIIVRC